MNTALTALESLRAGNRRFVSNMSKTVPSQARRASLVDGQAPSAIILACADSRVPPELVFDHGLGELFVVRVAGNVCSPATLASVEYAVSALDVPLIVVLGHTKCGAVKATIDAAKRGESTGSASIDDLVERISPAVAPVLDADLDSGQLMSAATRANVVNTADQLRHESPILRQQIRSGKLVVVSAEYALETGKVSFFAASSAPHAQASAA